MEWHQLTIPSEMRGMQLPALSLALGIGIAAATDCIWWVGLILIGAGIAIYIALLNASGNPLSAYRLNRWHSVWIIILFIGIGLSDFALSRPATLQQAFKDGVPDLLECEVQGVQTRSYGDRIEAEISGTNGAKVWIRTQASTIAPGDIICIPTESITALNSESGPFWRRIAPAANSKGILYLSEPPSERILKIGHSHSPRFFFGRIREWIEIKVEKSHLERPTARFVNAVLLGDKCGLNEEIRLTFAHGGTAHLLALSGMHLGIIAEFLIFFIMFAKYSGKYRWGYAMAIIGLWSYVLITGAANSSLRAAIMISLAYLGIILERKNSSKNALWSACLIILILDPKALLDAGFQLSFVCVGSLLYIAPRLNPMRHRLHPILYRGCEMLLATIVATAASFSITSHYFGQIPLQFLSTNVLLLPLFPIVLSGALLFTILLCMGFEFNLLGKALDIGYGVLVGTTEFLSGGAASVVEWEMPSWGVVVCMAVLALLAWTLNKKSEQPQ